MWKAGRITLKKGVFKGDKEVLDIFNKIYEKEYYSTGKTIGIVINLLDEEGAPVLSWEIARAVPVKISGAELRSEANEIAVESIEFVHEGIKLEFK